MNQKEQRQTALGATRSEMRKNGFDPKTESADNALRVLDDLARVEPNLIASKWYMNASDNQIILFEREWKKHQERWM